jgi:hypothetical protein
MWLIDVAAYQNNEFTLDICMEKSKYICHCVTNVISEFCVAESQWEKFFYCE